MTTTDSNPRLFKSILDYMRDGVIAVDRQGTIVAFNPAAGRILSLEPERALGQTLAELFFHDDDGSDEFSQAIFEAIYESTVILHKRVLYRRNGSERYLSVTTSSLLLGEAHERAGIICVFSDVTEVERLREAEVQLTEEIKGRHNELQKAYLDLETANTQMQTMGQRSSRIRILATGGVIALFIAIGGLTWWRSYAAVPRSPTVLASAPGANGGTIEAMPHKIESRITVPGVIFPGSVINVVAPFDGPIKEKHFDYGGQVERGATLLVMDTADLEIRVRDARAELIKAQAAQDALMNWNNSSEVATARGNALASQQGLQDLHRRAAATKSLLDQGIIAQSEYDGMVEQMRTMELQTQSAQRDLQNVLDRGNEQNRRVGELQLTNVKAKDSDLEDQLAHATVTAPVSGVVLRPPDDSSGGGGSSQQSRSLEVGTHVTKGQAIIAIGDLEKLSVTGTVDEIDVNKVAIGQVVEVANDAFTGATITGRLSAVSTQADGGSGHALPTFVIKADIDQITPEQRQHIRIGMTANLSIVLYSNPSAIVVPVDAVTENENGSNVRVKRPSGEIAEIPVTVGITTLEGVEIRSGLQPGDRVVVGAVPNS